MYRSTFCWLAFMTAVSRSWNLARSTPWIFCSLRSSATLSAVFSNYSRYRSTFSSSFIIAYSSLLHWIFRFSISLATSSFFSFYLT